MRALRKLLAVAFLAGASSAMGAVITPPDIQFLFRDGQANSSISQVPMRQLATQTAAPIIDPRNYGAVCDGGHHSISSTLGVSTAAGVAAFATASGATPFSWITNGTWAAKVPLTLAVAATAGNTTVSVTSVSGVPSGGVATITGTGVPGGTTATTVTTPTTVGRVTNGTFTQGTTSITVNSATAVPVGSHPIVQAGISYDDVVVSSTVTNVTLRYGLTATIGTGTTITFQPPSTILLSAALSANKPEITSTGTAATAGANYWLYATWPVTDAMVAAAEADWLGFQAAIEAATTSGGRVIAPAGTCVFNNGTVASNTLGGLVFHEDTGGTSYTKSADLVGQGIAVSNLTWPTDSGTGRAAISFGVPYATWDNGLGHYGANFYYGVLRDVNLIGPYGYTGQAVGTSGAAMTGIISGARRRMDGVGVHGFHIGATLEGVDHTDWGFLDLQNNDMCLRMGAVSASLFANDKIDHLEAWSCSLASLSLDKDALWSQTNINLFYGAFTPKVIRLEPGILSSYGQPSGIVMQNSTFANVLSESVGNGFMVDDNHGPNATTAAQGGAEMVSTGMDWQHVSINQATGLRPAGTRFNFWIDGGAMYDTRWSFIANNLRPVGGMQAGIWLDFANFGNGGDTFTADMTSALSAFGSTPLFAVSGNVLGGGQQSFAVRVIEPNTWAGHMEMYGSVTGAVQGTPLEYLGSCNFTDQCVQKASGTSMFAGINMTTATSINTPTIVATKLCGISATAVPITIPTSGTATATHWGKLATGGTVTNAASATDGVVIGTIMAIPGAGFARMNVGPNGSCD